MNYVSRQMDIPLIGDWLSYSPDSSPIENAWSWVKHHVERKNPCLQRVQATGVAYCTAQRLKIPGMQRLRAGYSGLSGGW